MKKKKPRIATNDTGQMYTQCPNQSVPYLIGDSNDKKTRKIVKARCKQWDCEFCSQINREQHYNRIANGLSKLSQSGYSWTFTTITCHERWRGTEAGIKNWNKNKDKLLARYRRYVKKHNSYQPQYVYIPEFHADGTVHIHGIFSGNVQTRWWKDNARTCGLGYMAESAEIKSVLQAVNYCLKYITKQMGVASPKKNLRRINYSRGFPTETRSSSQLEWRLLQKDEAIQDAILEGLLTKGYDVEFDRKQWTTDDFLT